MGIRWYGLDASLRTVEHDDVALDQAYVILDRHFGLLQSHYDSGEEALSATMFGFQRSDGSYMQICIHALNCIDVEHDFSLNNNPLFRLIGGRRQRDERLTSRDELRARTRLFFTLSPQDFRKALRSERPGGQSGPSEPGA